MCKGVHDDHMETLLTQYWTLNDWAITIAWKELKPTQRPFSMLWSRSSLENGGDQVDTDDYMKITLSKQSRVPPTPPSKKETSQLLTEAYKSLVILARTSEIRERA